MSKLTRSQVLELAFWLLLAGSLFAYTFAFDRAIEIYRYGAAAWPRGVLILIAIAAVGQALQVMFARDKGPDEGSGAAVGEDAGAPPDASAHPVSWYVGTAFLLAVPFVYMIVPTWIARIAGLERGESGMLKLVVAAVLVVVYLAAARRNQLGAMLSLPIMFAALMQDIGFYSLAPVFVVGVMVLMGERRAAPMTAVTVVSLVVILVLFVSLLYVGLPTGNIPPFYEIGTTVVKWLQ